MESESPPVYRQQLAGPAVEVGWPLVGLGVVDALAKGGTEGGRREGEREDDDEDICLCSAPGRI